jgi:cardiolipin synthase A/B
MAAKCGPLNGTFGGRERHRVKLLIQPEDGVSPIVAALNKAKKSIEVLIFRLDRKQIEEALQAAAARGVAVRALVAFSNRGGEQQLRRLETRLLAAGVTVTRTGDDLARYHAKMLLIDRSLLYVLSFNYTTVDMEHSRAFGIVTRNATFIQEAVKLFETDSTRQTYEPGLNTFLVSPLNARRELSGFLRKARKELLIYDPKISDPQMVQLLQERWKAGVQIRIIGRLGKRAGGLTAERLREHRLHTRTIVRDRKQAFVGSQSLRKVELDARRELGLIVKDPSVVRQLVAVFERDWTPAEKAEPKRNGARKEAKNSIDKLAKHLDPLSAAVKRAVKKVVAKTGDGALADGQVKDAVKEIVKKTVKRAVKEAVEDAAEKVESA